MSIVAAAARAYFDSGLNVIPLQLDGSKSPTVKWQKYTTERVKDVERLFSGNVGLAVLGGSTSGGLEIIDFDAADLFTPWCELVEHVAPGLIARLPVVKTPNGYHVYLRSALCAGNQKLAMDDKINANKNSSVLIETRGQGGYVLAPPSPTSVHASGIAYAMHQGALTSIPTLTDDEHEVLFSCARSFNKQVTIAKSERKPIEGVGEGRPGDDFRMRGSWSEALVGWTEVRSVGQVTYWRRPGKKDRGISATTGYCSDMFYTFSSNAAPFESGRAYNRFSVYAHLNHGGDFGEAAKALRKAGYGSKTDTRPERKAKPAKGWDELAAEAPPPMEMPPLPTDDDAPPDIEPLPSKAPIASNDLDDLLDNDAGAALAEPTFSKLMAAREDPAEWARIEKVLKRHGVIKNFLAQAKKKKAKPVEDRDGWKAKLLYRDNKEGFPVIENCTANHTLILRHDQTWLGVLAFDEFSNQITTKNPPPFKRHGSQWSDADVVETKMWLERNYPLRPTTLAVHEAVIAAAKQATFNPLVDYLDSLEDQGREALDTWLIDFFGAPDTPYTRAVGAKWMIAAVARAYDPGCKVDTVLILEGKQGLKKSRVLEQLCPKLSWFTDGLSEFGSKAQAEEVEGKWIIELGELKGFGREQEQIKAFVTRRAENYRPAYARNSTHSPRKCVFAGTVNPSAAGYLRDDTGNRRYWPVECRKQAPDLTPQLRDQLWAEARARYQAGERWWLEEEELNQAAAEEQGKRAHIDAWHELVEEKVHGEQDTSVDEVLSKLGVTVDRRDTAASMRVGRVLNALGWTRYRYRWPNNNRLTWRYKNPTYDTDSVLRQQGRGEQVEFPL